jgi:hypothetical protein
VLAENRKVRHRGARNRIKNANLVFARGCYESSAISEHDVGRFVGNIKSVNHSPALERNNADAVRHLIHDP